MSSAKVEAQTLLAKCNGLPLKAFWQALKNTRIPRPNSLAIAMAIVTDARCGIERRMSFLEREVIGCPLYSHPYVGATAIILAACADRADVVAGLVKAGADVNATDGKGTALHWANLEGLEDVVKVLLENGADLTLREKAEYPLHLSAYTGNTQTLALLLSFGADVNTIDENGWSALSEAGHGAHFEAVRALLDHGANIQAVDKEGQGVLHTAANCHETVEEGYLEVLDIIVAEGCDVTYRDSAGQTALDMYDAKIARDASTYLRSLSEQVRSLLQPHLTSRKW